MVQQERTRIVSALQTTNWNMSKAARELSWCRMTLYRKIAKYKIVKRAKPRVTDPSFQPQAHALPPGVEHNPWADSAQKWRAVGRLRTVTWRGSRIGYRRRCGLGSGTLHTPTVTLSRSGWAVSQLQPCMSPVF
jgi:hypothetical protein